MLARKVTRSMNVRTFAESNLVVGYTIWICGGSNPCSTICSRPAFTDAATWYASSNARPPPLQAWPIAASALLVENLGVNPCRSSFASRVNVHSGVKLIAVN